jgi:2-polyprenyl-3-methyl-5-hydroxy-6-metoxy-1,4-benzoquinol methylase
VVNKKLKNNKNLKEFYNKVYIKGENKHFTSFLISGSSTSEAKEVLKEVNWSRKKIIDIGCGTGEFAFLAAKKGAIVTAIDYSIDAIKTAKKKFQHKNLEYSVTDAFEIKEKFDVIISLGTLEHMDDPFSALDFYKSLLKKNGKIIITTPNWTNPRGYVLMTLYHLFSSPITLADLNYLTPVNHKEWAKKLDLSLKWRTIERSWGHGDILIKDFERRIPKVLSDSKLLNKKKNVESLIKWLEDYVLPLDNSLPQSGAVGLYVYSNNIKKLIYKT